MLLQVGVAERRWNEDVVAEATRPSLLDCLISQERRGFFWIAQGCLSACLSSRHSSSRGCPRQAWKALHCAQLTVGSDTQGASRFSLPLPATRKHLVQREHVQTFGRPGFFRRRQPGSFHASEMQSGRHIVAVGSSAGVEVETCSREIAPKSRIVGCDQAEMACPD